MSSDAIETIRADPSEKLPTVLVVDDEQAILKAVGRQLRRCGVEVILAPTPTEAISVFNRTEVAVLISDYMMPGMNGLDLLALVRRRWPDTQGILLTACEDIRIAAEAVNRHLVTAFITKPWDLATMRRSVEDAVKTYREQMSGSGDGSLVNVSLVREIELQAVAAAFSLARAVDARDHHTHSHSEKVAAYAQVVGSAMGLQESELHDLRIGGLLHDLGKIGVSDNILLKRGRLTDEEYRVIRCHPQIGASIIEPLNFSSNIRAVIRQHHENHDGSGYPHGLYREDIALPARIAHVVDAYEAMSSDRVYRAALPPEWIMAELMRNRGTQFDPEATDVFIEELQSRRLDAATSDPVVSGNDWQAVEP